MREKLAAGLRKWSDTKELSWVGHGLQGLLFGAVGGLIGVGVGHLLGVPSEFHALLGTCGIVYTHGVFSHREGDGALQVYLDADDHASGWAHVKAHMMDDGYNDYAAPMIASVAGWIAVMALLGA